MNITRMGDFIYALRIISILTTPWDQQAAFKHGIIDSEGKRLRRYRDLRTGDEKDSFTYLHRIVFNMKRILNKAPGGDKWLAAATASYLLLREGLEELDISESQWKKIEETIYNLHEDTPTNATGAAVSTDTPKPFGFKIKGKTSLARRKEVA